MVTTALLIILAVLLATFIRKAVKINEYWAKRGIKHLKPVPFFGNNLLLVLGRKSPQDIIETLYSEYPKELVLGYYDFMSPRLFVRDPDLILKVLIKDFAYFTNHGIEMDAKANPKDEQLFLMNGARWRAVRAKVSPIFTSGKLKEMFSTMTSVGDNLLSYLKENEKEEIDALESMELFSTDVISSAVFGMDPATLKNPHCEFRKMGKKINDQNIINIIRLWMALAFPKVMKAFGISIQSQTYRYYFCKIIQNTLDIRKKKGIQRNDFIQMMMQIKDKGHVEVHDWDASDDYLKTEDSGPIQEKVEFTDDLLMSQALSFMVTGFSSTAIIMAYTLYEMTQNLEVQSKVHEEIIEQVKLYGGITYDALKDMRFLECSIKETQRFYPSLPALFRVCTKTYELPNGYIIEKGDPVSIPVAAVHLDPNNFPEPRVYKPERFLDPIKPGTFMPFGEGPRMCIAMRYTMLVMKYGLACFLMNYKVKLSTKTSVPFKINTRSFGAVPKERILLCLEQI